MREPEHQTWKNMTAEESAQRASAEARGERVARAKAMTPETRAGFATLHPALANAETFCALLARASLAKLTQDGSAFRYHPKFYITERLVLVNEWRRDDCAIYVIPKGVELTDAPENDPRSEFSTAWPEFSGRRGAVLLFKVWQNGLWLHEGPWQQDASEVLSALEVKLDEHRRTIRDPMEARLASEVERRRHLEAMARQAYATTSEQEGADGHDR